MKALLCLAVGGAALALGGCSSDAVSPNSGLEEPMRARPVAAGASLHPAQFHEGNPRIVPDGPTTTLETSGSIILPPGKAAKSFVGLASLNAVAIGIRLRDFGSGYWTIPTGAIDRSSTVPAVAWRSEVDIGYGLPSGFTPLRAFAIDDAGNAGPPTDIPICLAPPVPDNAASCNPAAKPPAVVLSLSWDNNADLDLRLVTPSGVSVGPGRSPTTAGPEGGGGADPSVGKLELDATRGCFPDGRRRENIVWQGRPAAGTYTVYANLFDACELGSVRFNVDLYVAGQAAEEGQITPQARTYLGSGILLALDANGGAGPGLFVTEFVLR